MGKQKIVSSFAKTAKVCMAILGAFIVALTANSIVFLGDRFYKMNRITRKETDLLNHFTLSLMPENVTQAMKIPSPVFVMSLPKSGTSSLQAYFNCGLSRMKRRTAAHHWGKKSNGKRDKLGNCFRYNHVRNKPLTDGCGNYSVWIDAGVPARDNCFYPGLDALEDLVKHHPNCTLVLGTRPAQNWLQSALTYDRGSLIERWKHNCPRFPNASVEEGQSEWLDFYNSYTQRIRSFAKAHPRMTYVEVELESQKASSLLREAIGIEESCFQKCRPGGVGCEPIV